MTPTNGTDGRDTSSDVSFLRWLLSPVDEPKDSLDRACTWAIRIGVAVVALGLVAFVVLLCGMVLSII